MMHEVTKMIVEIVALTAVFAASVGFAFHKRRGHGISVIIPFRASNDIQRIKNILWLTRYWRKALPGAEVIIGKDSLFDQPFSKSVAVNSGVAKSKGDVLVIVDADGYISADAVLHCAEEIRDARKRGQKLWFVPYRKFYRLTQCASHFLLQSDPDNPFRFPDPLPEEFVLGDTDPAVGHWYGAMIQICPREAFETVGGWDERFRGWGNEDHAAMRAMDTLYGPHKTLPGQVLHVWHPQIGPQGKQAQVHWKERMWAGQDEPGINDKLGGRYYGAYLNPDKMRKLLDEGKEGLPVTEGDKHPRQGSV
jgi:glycosyltransferase involved in cell wall biosynthesis